jgi:PmbA protein
LIPNRSQGNEHLPVTEEEARRAAGYALERAGQSSMDVLITASSSGVTRFADSQIIQNTVRREVRAYVRVARGDRRASASTNQLDAGHMKDAARRALERALVARPDPHWPGLPDPGEVGRAEGLFRFDEPTALMPPAARARGVAEIVSAAGGDNAAGVYETGAHAYGVWSTTGIACFDTYSRCVATCLVDRDGAAGWGDASSHAADEVDLASVGRRARFKAEAARGPAHNPPGVFEVVLEPRAVAELIDYLAYSGFGAKQAIEGDSFLCQRAGQRVAAGSVTVADDVRHPRSVGTGFDVEGVPKRRVAVIDGGLATGPVTDLRTAKRLDVAPTGHASGSDELGPYASHVVVEEGTDSLEDLIGGVDDGLLVTRFHYVNILDRRSTLLTGMTRDGTFRIRDGELAGAVHNLRFTQNVLEALAAVTGVGHQTASFAPDFGNFGSTVAPALRIAEFRFTSTTSH